MKVLKGEYKMLNVIGRRNSKVWNYFARVLNEKNLEIPKIVVCKRCKHVYRYNTKSSSNLIRHKCYIACMGGKVQLSNFMECTGSDAFNLVASTETIPKPNNLQLAGQPSVENVPKATPTLKEEEKTDIDEELKKQFALFFIKWCIQDCRPFSISQDVGLKNLLKFTLNLGKANINVNDVIPEPEKISNSIFTVNQTYAAKLKNELEKVKEIGFTLTSDIRTDSNSKLIYICLTIHYIADKTFRSRVLGLRSISNDRCTGTQIFSEIQNILEFFNLKFDENVLIVADKELNMINAFPSDRQLNCLNRLLSNAIEKTCADILEIQDIINNCNEIALYFNRVNLDILVKKLKNYIPKKWNTIFYLFDTFVENWIVINKILEDRKESHKIGKLKINTLTSIRNLFQILEEFSKTIENTNNITIHYTFTYLNYLSTCCDIKNSDSDLIKKFKQSLLININTIIYPNLTIYHKLALFLFPPTNQMKRFTDVEKKLVTEKCMELMEIYSRNNSHTEEQPYVSNESMKIFGDLISNQKLISPEQKIINEINSYSKLCIYLEENFDALKWWDSNKKYFPLLYQLSCKIFSIPATCSKSEETLCKAVNLISQKKSNFDTTRINAIMFLNSYLNDEQIENELKIIA